MTSSGAVPAGERGAQGSIFNGPAAFQVGDHGVQHVQFVYQWEAAYRIEDYPAAPRPVSARMLAQQPSRLLRAVHQVVPFTGRDHDLEKMARWRDDPAPGLAVRLVHGPGGQGKTRLASHFASLSRAEGWTVWQAAVNESGTAPLTTSPPPETGIGVLLVVDYAERWPTTDLRRLLQEPLLHGTRLPVRVLLLARPAGIWWESLDTWLGDTLNAPAEPHPLLPLATDPTARARLFGEARDRFADRLGLPPDQADLIGPPQDLDADEDYAQILTIHIAALASVDACLHVESAPANPARASAYLLKRERLYWSELHQRRSQPLSTPPEAMGRAVVTATLTRPLARAHGQTALNWIGLADSTAAANRLLDDHRYCYPPPHADSAHTVTVLEPLYPDRLGEDFLGLSTPASPNGPDPHPVPEAVTDDWAHQAAERLLLDPTGTSTVAPWTRGALTVLIETARRWPHIATGQLYPLLKKHPELALQAGGTTLATLASLETIDLTVLEAIEPHFPTGRHADLDVGIAAITARLARHRLATTDDLASRATTYENLAIRQRYAGLHDEALSSGQHALQAWRNLTLANPANESDLARLLSSLGAFLSDVGRRDEALTASEEAVAVYRRLTADTAAAHAPDFAASLSNHGAFLAAVGQRDEALTAVEESVRIRRRLVADDPATHEPDLAASLTNLGILLSEAGRREEALTAGEEAVAVYRRLTASNSGVYEVDLTTSLSNLGNLLSAVGRREEALAAAEEALHIRRTLAADNPAAHEPDLAGCLSNLGNRLAEAGQPDEALAAEQEAVQIRRTLAVDNPAAHEPDLAASLSNLGNRLSEAGRRIEALAAAEEALHILRTLVADNPAAHEPNLAGSLSNLSTRLSAVGRREEALAAAEEALHIWRRLAASNPAAHEPNLAASLSTWAWARYQAQNDLPEALLATGEAVEIYRRLVTATPSRFLSPLHAVLDLQSHILLMLGRLREAREIRAWLSAKDGVPDSLQ